MIPGSGEGGTPRPQRALSFKLTEWSSRYGPRWAQAATAPSRLYKAFTTEGGVRVPFLAKFPKAGGPEPNAQGITDRFATVMDLAPTMLEMAGVEHPAPYYQGREVVKMRGTSMMPFIRGFSETIHPADFINGWETCGRAAVRRGDWKIVFIPKPKGPEKWQLYNLAKDPGELDDLADEHPGMMKEMLKLWDDYVLECGVVPISPELGRYLAETEAQMEESVWMEYDFWKPGARDEPEKFMRRPLRFARNVHAL